jgi:hypothetical protein
MARRKRVPGIIPDDPYDGPKTGPQKKFLKKRNSRLHRLDAKRQLKDPESDGVLVNRRDNLHSGG